MFTRKLNSVIFFVIFATIILFIVSIKLDLDYQKKLLNEELSLLKISIKSEYKKRLKNSVNNAIIFIQSYCKILLEEQKKQNPKMNKLSSENIKKLENIIREYSYNSIYEKNIYIWVNKLLKFEGGDNYAVRLIHPNLKNTEGKLLSTKSRDIKGNLPYLEELEGIKKNGELFFTYFFKELTKDRITEKLSYAKLEKDLNWIVATGIPINDLNDLIEEEKKKIESSYKKHELKIFFIRFFIFITFIILLFFMRKFIYNILNKNVQLNEQLAQKLRKIETNFDKFFELPMNLLIITNEKGNIIQVNSGWTKMLGYSKEELIGKHFLDFTHKDDKSLVQDEMKKLSTDESTTNFEIRFLTKDNKYKNLSWAVNSQKKDKLFYGIAQDVTQLKEKSILINQQSKISAIAQMAIHIAHQWRQPLSLINTISSGVLLKKSINDLDDKFLNDNMEKINVITQELSQTIESFEDFFNTNKEITLFETKEVINKALNLVENRYEDINTNIKIIKNIENFTIKNYENELLQVFITILSVIEKKFTESNYEEKLICVNSREINNQICIDFFANLNTIEEERLNKLFESYFSNNEIKLNKGITLQMCKEVIKTHLGGKFKVENYTYTTNDKSYEGVKFTIILEQTS